MTDQELQEIREKYEHPMPVGDLIIETYDIVPKLLDEIERLKAELANTESRVMVQSVDSEILAEEIERLNAERQWISVKDRLPEGGNLAVVLTLQKIPEWFQEDMMCITTASAVQEYSHSHWMPLPEVPKSDYPQYIPPEPPE